jgi:putative transposase
VDPQIQLLIVLVNDDVSKHHRRSIRLRGYDYAQSGAYFVTIVTSDRAYLFGEVANGEMRLNDRGGLIHSVWDELPDHYPSVECDAFIVMPNHVHGIILLVDRSGVELNDVGAGFETCPDRIATKHRAGGFKTRPYTTWVIGNYPSVQNILGAAH